MKMKGSRLLFRAVVLSAVLLCITHGNLDDERERERERGWESADEAEQQRLADEVREQTDRRAREAERSQRYQEERHAAPSNAEAPKMHAHYSFRPPFKNFTVQGDRYIPGWSIGGSTSVKENFVRLTPDRQSKQGWIFNSNPLELEEFSAQLRFRISGQGKNLFGDGMGFWVTQKPQDSFDGGPLLGSTDKLFGFGILFDTFRNSEPGHVHKDVSVVQSDGSEIDLSTKRPGCASRYRYHEGKDNFDIDSQSVVRLSVKNNFLSVSIDAMGKGQFRKCLEVDLGRGGSQPKLENGWMRQTHVHFAFSASTGALADNHDVLEFTVAPYGEIETVVTDLKDAADALPVKVDVDRELHPNEVGEHVNELSAEFKRISDDFKKFQHKLEHRLETVQEDIKGAIKKLQSEEDLAEERIAKLEARSQDFLTRSVEERVRSVEDRVSGAIEDRLRALETRFNTKVDSVAGGAGGWKIPFFLFGAVVLVGLFFNFRSIRHINKIDKLI